MASNEKINKSYSPFIHSYIRTFRIKDNILSGVQRSYPRCTNIGELILDKLKNKPDFVGQVEALTEKKSTYAEMKNQSIKCALWLRKQGIQKGDKIGIWTDNHINTYVPVYASLYVGAIMCPWDEKVSKVSAKYCLSLTSPKIVFANANSVDNLVEAAREKNLEVKVVVIGSLPGYVSLTDILNDQVSPLEIDRFQCTVIDNPHDTAMICHSSGTTGMPKGTELSYVSLYNSITPTECVHMINEVTLSMPTIRWHYGLTVIFELVMSNAKWIIIPSKVLNNTDQICKIIQDNKVTWLGCDISFPNYLLKYDILQEYPMPSLKKLVVTGGPFSKQAQGTLAEKMRHTLILNCYGLTDAGGLCISQTNVSTPGSCGYVTKGVQLKIVDEKTGKLLGPNEQGELCVKSEFIMKGYHKNPEETRNMIDADGWLHTKDILYYNDSGEFYFVSRISDFINYRSIKLSPAEIEGILKMHPSVFNAVVVPIPNKIDIEHPMAFIEKVIGKEVTGEELYDLVAENLPSYCKLIGGIKFVDKLPRLSNGKIDRKQLKLLAESYELL